MNYQESDSPRKGPPEMFKRLIAFIIDISVMIALGFVLGKAFSSIWIDMGSSALLVGYGILILYFAVTGSKWGGGHTIGQYVMKTVLVDRDGEKIGLALSAARSLIVLSPYFLMSSTTMASFWKGSGWDYFYDVAYILTYSMVIGNMYLFVFNRNAGQLVHDLIFSTYVTNVSSPPTGFPRTKTIHCYVLGGILLASATWVMGMGLVIEKQMGTAMPRPVSLEGINYREAGIEQINISRSDISHDGHLNSIYMVDAVMQTEPRFPRAQCDDIALFLMNNDSQLVEADSLMISWKYGFNIGIYCEYDGMSRAYNRQELHDLRTQ